MTTTSRSERNGFDGEGIEDSEYVNVSRGGVLSTRTKRIAVSLAVVVMMVLVSATVMISSSAKEPTPETTATTATTDDYVRVGMVSPVVSWNPLTVTMAGDYMMSALIYSSLFTYDENWGGPVMDLATGWAFFTDSNDSMITFINITHNAYFRSIDDLSGTDHQLSAEDVEFTFNLIKSGSGSAYGIYLEDITVLGTANQSGTGDFQDQIVLQTPYPKATLIDDIASVPILPKHVWETYSNPFTALQPSDLVGSGPFVFENSIVDTWYMFKKAPNYHGETDYGEERSVKVDGIVYEIWESAGGLVIEMNSGELDVISLTDEIDLFNYLGYGASVPITKQAVQELGICDIALNAIPYDFRVDLPGSGDDWGITDSLGNPHLQDPEVRKAILMTLNKEYICDFRMGGLATEADSVITPGFWQADIDGVLPFNISGARDVLLAAGYYDDGGTYMKAGPGSYVVQNGLVAPGAELAHIRCHAPSTDVTYGDIAFAWKGWAKEAGIGLDSEVVQEAIMVNDDWYKADYDIWVWHWFLGPEPISDLSIWLTEEMTSGGTNCQMPMGEWWYGWSNYTQAPSVWSGLGETIEYTPTGPYSSFDQNISIAMKTLDPMERKAILDDLQQVIYDSYCESPPFYDLGLYGYTDCRFTNWGDFTAHPGRAFTSGLCWLWFDLQPVGYNQMPVFTTPPLPFYEVEVGVPITFVFGFIDPDGDPIGVNWSFGDGGHGSSYITGDTTEETLISVTYAYTEEATNLTLTIYLNDIPFHTEYTIATSCVNVYPHVNQPPVIHFVSYDPPTADVGQEVTWTIGVSDPDSGFIIRIDWGDGTSSVYYYFVAAGETLVANETIINLTESKSWAEAGTYYVDISVNDYQSNVSVTIPYTVGYSPNVSEVNYQWHNMFGHEFGSWMEYREGFALDEWAITDSYPYIGLRGSMPIGDTDIYTFMQLDIDGQAMPELNMNDSPQFLPLFGDANGGTAEIDWYMNYITVEEGMEKLPPEVILYFDGWFIALNGTVSLDEQAAMAVLGITSEQFDDFDAWWAANGNGVKADWHDWLLYEGNDRLDIYAMYEYPLTFAYFEMDAVKSGSDEVIIYMDTISWGMEALMARWLRDAFMPTEWYMEDMNFHAVIGPESTDLDIDAAVAYSVFAYESVIDGEPCWAWQAMMQDRIFSFSDHPSLLDPYIGLELLERSPSSVYNGEMVPYDFTPGAWDLSENETLSFEWPEEEVLFFVRDEGNETSLVPDTSDFWSEMTVRYLEPDASDAPAGVNVDLENRTITFDGPFDMRTWSEEQTEHEWLADEWDRLGVLPYGVPYIEFCPADSAPNYAPNASFVVTPESGPVGTVFTFNASSSFDLEDSVELLKVQWDWNGDGVWDTALSTEKVAVHQYMTEGNYTVFLKVVDTDGLVGQTVRTVLVYAPAPLSATVDIDKDRVNIAGRGGWITAYIELPEGYDVADINITTVRLEGALFADPTTWSIGDYDLDGIPDLAVRFDRANLSYVLEVGDEVNVTVSGVLADGTPFEGVDVIEVVNPKASVAVLSAILDVTLSSVSLAALIAVLIALAAIGAAALCHHRMRSERARTETPSSNLF